MSCGFFITGTGTDVGKTVVTAGLARYLMQAGHDVLTVKPVQSGGVKNVDGGLGSPDGEVYKAAGASWNIEKQCPVILEPACSPHLAAEIAGVKLNIKEIVDKAKRLESEATLLVEGAGGIMVPINDQETMLDLMKEFDYPVVLVSENKLGAINEVLLSVKALSDAGLEVAGVIMTAANGPEPSEYGMAEDNVRTIEQFSGVKVLASIPYIEDWSLTDPACWDQVDSALSVIDLK